MELKEYLAQVDGAYGALKGGALRQRLEALLEDCRETYGPQSANTAAMLNELGAYHRGQGELERSESFFMQALAIFSETGGRESEDWATTMNNLAGTHRLMGRLEQAEQEFSACLAVYEKTLGKEHILYASALNNLSLIAIGRGDLDSAAERQSAAAGILRKNPGNRDELATAMCNLGALYQRLGRAGESKAHFLEAVEMYRGELGTATPHYHAALNGMGAACYTAGEFEAALSWFRLAAEAAERLYGREHPEYAAVQRHIEMAGRAARGESK